MKDAEDLWAWQRTDSAEDSSINWTRAKTDGVIETRFVQREAEKFIVYLSSQTGCAQACRMCWLTQTGQTGTTSVPYYHQANMVLRRVVNENLAPEAKVVHFNFMARGEPLENQLLRHDSADTLLELGRLALDLCLVRPKFLVSTIMPRSFDSTLVETFPLIRPEIYYSLYSMDPDFRARWLPKAMPAEQALDQLAAWQQETHKIPKLHFAFIKGENDCWRQMTQVAQAVNDRKLRVDLNIVRYNPPNSKSEEPNEASIDFLVRELQRKLPDSKLQVVPRVGRDVYASCGMFTPKGTEVD